MSAWPAADGPDPSALPHQQKDLFSLPSKVIKGQAKSPIPARPRTPQNASVVWRGAPKTKACRARPSWPSLRSASSLVSSLFTPIKGTLGALTYHCCSVNDWHKYYFPMTLNLNFFPKAFARLFCSCPYNLSLSICLRFHWGHWASGRGGGRCVVSFFYTLGSISSLEGLSPARKSKSHCRCWMRLNGGRETEARRGAAWHALG